MRQIPYKLSDEPRGVASVFTHRYFPVPLSLRATTAMLLLAAFSVMGLLLGLADYFVPYITGGLAFGNIPRPDTQGEVFILGLRAFVHNWGVALVVPVIGGLAVHDEPRSWLVAGILLVAVGMGSISGFAFLPPDILGVREMVLLPAEVGGILLGACLGAVRLASSSGKRTLEETCDDQLRRNTPAIALSFVVLAVAAFVEMATVPW